MAPNLKTDPTLRADFPKGSRTHESDTWVLGNSQYSTGLG